jgi:hypothetical protein
MKQQFGNMLEQYHTPEVGETAWVFMGQVGMVAPSMGTVIAVYNIDNKGPGNTYCDVLVGDRTAHCPINVMFDHKPRKVVVSDRYGEVRIWK